MQDESVPPPPNPPLPPDQRTYPSVVANLFDTGLHWVIFRTVGASGRGVMDVTAADFADSLSLEAMEERTKAAGSLGTLVGERGSTDLLRDVCRHPSNPFRLVNFVTYYPTFFDLAVLVHGTLDGTRAVWDQLIVPNLTQLGISVDPGVVPRSPFAPDEGSINAPLPGGQADPAMQALSQAIDALRSLQNLNVVGTVAGTPPVATTIPITQTDEWKTNVVPLLAAPFMSGV